MTENEVLKLEVKRLSELVVSLKANSLLLSAEIEALRESKQGKKAIFNLDHDLEGDDNWRR